MIPIKLMIVDDQQIIRDGLKALCALNESVHVITEADNGQDAHTKALKYQPDVILMDIRMPVLDGVEAIKLIKKDAPHIKIIILTTFDDDAYIIKAMSYGASGYLLKDTSSDKLFQAIIDSLSGHIILPGQIAAKIVSRLNQTSLDQCDTSHFSPREIDVIKLLIAGKTNQEISETLFLSIGTVKNYLSQIYQKINVTDRSNAILYFKSQGF